MRYTEFDELMEEITEDSIEEQPTSNKNYGLVNENFNDVLTNIFNGGNNYCKESNYLALDNN